MITGTAGMKSALAGSSARPLHPLGVRTARP